MEPVLNQLDRLVADLKAKTDCSTGAAQAFLKASSDVPPCSSTSFAAVPGGDDINDEILIDSMEDDVSPVESLRVSRIDTSRSSGLSKTRSSMFGWLRRHARDVIPVVIVWAILWGMLLILQRLGCITMLSPPIPRSVYQRCVMNLKVHATLVAVSVMLTCVLPRFVRLQGHT